MRFAEQTLAGRQAAPSSQMSRRVLQQTRAAQLAPSAVFGLLVAAVFAHVWFASTPLPFGGPNVWLAGLAILGAAACLVAPVLGAQQGARGAVLGKRLRELRPLAPALVVVGLACAWAALVGMVNASWDHVLLGKMALGMGVFFAVFLTVDNVRRGSAFALTLLVATAVSALFGALLLLFGEPFISLWLLLTQVPDEQLSMALRGASSGLAGHPSTLGNQLSVAIPVALSAVAWAALRSGRWRWRVAGIALCCTLFGIVATMLLVNGSRSSVVGTIAGVGMTAWLWLRHCGDRRRTSMVLALTVISLAALWLVLAGVFGMSKPPQSGEVQGLVGGADVRWAAPGGMVGHRFGGLSAGVYYQVGLSEQYIEGRGPWTRANAIADADGGVVLAWRRNANDRVLGYRFFALAPRRWPLPSNEYVTPSLPTPTPPRICAADREADLRLAVGELAAVAGMAGVDRQWSGFWREMEKSATPVMANVVGAAVYLEDAAEQTVEVRACSAKGFGPAAQAVTTAVPGQPVILTWREPQAVGQLEYQFRSRSGGRANRGEWRMVQPVRYARGPAFGTIGVGGRSLGSGPPAIGHEFRGFAHARWFAVQIRARRATGFDAPLEVAAKADARGRLVLVWAEPKYPATVVGYQFRLRRAGFAEWRPWRDFAPTLSSKVPVPELLPAAAGGDQDRDVRRHLLTGLVPGFVYRVQMRAWNEYGYGAESADLLRAAGEDGMLPLTWRETGVPSGATGYQFRLWHRGAYEWWQGMALLDGRTEALTVDDLRGRKDEQLAFARTARDLAGGRIVFQRRLFREPLNMSAHSRVRDVAVAWRYALDHPLGTGEFAPKRGHMGPDAQRSFSGGVPPEEPHNQFLHMLVLFGVPGLALQVVFYGLVAHAAVRCAKVATRARSSVLRFLGASAVGGCVAYFAGGLLLPYGPLLHDWDHFFVIGLLFAVPRIAERTLD